MQKSQPTYMIESTKLSSHGPYAQASLLCTSIQMPPSCTQGRSKTRINPKPKTHVSSQLLLHGSSCWFIRPFGFTQISELLLVLERVVKDHVFSAFQSSKHGRQESWGFGRRRQSSISRHQSLGIFSHSRLHVHVLRIWGSFKRTRTTGCSPSLSLSLSLTLSLCLCLSNRFKGS